MITKPELQRNNIKLNDSEFQDLQDNENKAELYRNILIKLIDYKINKLVVTNSTDFDCANYTEHRAWKDGQIFALSKIKTILKE